MHFIIGRRSTVSSLLLNLAALQDIGTSYDKGKCFLALHVTMKHVEKAELNWNNENNTVRGLALAFTEAAEVTGVSKSKIRDLFNSYLTSGGSSFFVGDNTTRGRASANCDHTKFHKLTNSHYDATRAFIAFRNS